MSDNVIPLPLNASSIEDSRVGRRRRSRSSRLKKAKLISENGNKKTHDLHSDFSKESVNGPCKGSRKMKQKNKGKRYFAGKSKGKNDLLKQIQTSDKEQNLLVFSESKGTSILKDSSEDTIDKKNICEDSDSSFLQESSQDDLSNKDLWLPKKSLKIRAAKLRLIKRFDADWLDNSDADSSKKVVKNDKKANKYNNSKTANKKNKKTYNRQKIRNQGKNKLANTHKNGKNRKNKGVDSDVLEIKQVETKKKTKGRPRKKVNSIIKTSQNYNKQNLNMNGNSQKIKKNQIEDSNLSKLVFENGSSKNKNELEEESKERKYYMEEEKDFECPRLIEKRKLKNLIGKKKFLQENNCENFITPKLKKIKIEEADIPNEQNSKDQNETQLKNIEDSESNNKPASIMVENAEKIKECDEVKKETKERHVEILKYSNMRTRKKDYLSEKKLNPLDSGEEGELFTTNSKIKKRQGYRRLKNKKKPER